MQNLLKQTKIALLILISLGIQSVYAGHDDDNGNYQNRSGERARTDRYLDVEIWENHDDGEYFVGDNINFNFRVNQDAFVVVYSIDSRNRVNLLFPSHAGKDNFVRGGTTYHLPDGSDDYDLVVTGPEGTEYIQIIASRERIKIPDWHKNSGVINDWDDAHDFMDYVNQKYFVRYDGQRFAYDRSVLYVNEWEETYFSPVYSPYYPSWTVVGNLYFDYPYGSSIYINGIYYGIAPLYIPRLHIGWHTVSVYDSYGYGWESDIHLTRYNTVVLDRHIINTQPHFYSKYKEVRRVGYRSPAKHGYPNYEKKIRSIESANKHTGNYLKDRIGKSGSTYSVTTHKKFSRGSSKIKKTSRGWETTEVVTKRNNYRTTRGTSPGYKTDKSHTGSKNSGYGKTTRKSGNSTKSDRYQGYNSGKSKSGNGHKTYGSDRKKQSSGKQYKGSKKSGKSSKKSVGKRVKKSGKSSGKSSSRVKKSSPRKSSGSKVRSGGKSSRGSSGSRSKSSGGSHKSGGHKKSGGKKR